jgi:hypothetical protein
MEKDAVGYPSNGHTNSGIRRYLASRLPYCDDSTIMTQSGQVIVGFTRSAPSREDAIVSAISDIERANVGAWVKKVEPVVTESDTSHDDLAIAINTEARNGDIRQS